MLLPLKKIVLYSEVVSVHCRVEKHSLALALSFSLHQKNNTFLLCLFQCIQKKSPNWVSGNLGSSCVLSGRVEILYTSHFLFLENFPRTAESRFYPIQFDGRCILVWIFPNSDRIDLTHVHEAMQTDNLQISGASITRHDTEFVIIPRDHSNDFLHRRRIWMDRNGAKSTNVGQ